MKRQPRGKRHRGVSVQLQPRDVELLHALARLRIAPTRDLAALCFPGVRRDTAAARLRALFDCGYLAVSAPERTAENLYSVGPRGRVLLREAGEETRPVPRGGLTHHLGIVRAWVALASTAVPGIRLELARPDWELRAEFGDRGLSVVPDLFVVLCTPGRQVAMAVEVDLATEPLHVLRDKIRAYAELLADPAGLFGWREFGLALVLGNGQRRAALKRLLKLEWDGWSLIWTLHEGPDEELRRLVVGLEHPPTPSPYGKGRHETLSVDLSTHADRTDGGLSKS